MKTTPRPVTPSQKPLRHFLLASSIAYLAGCGGGSSDALVTPEKPLIGVFLDSAVSGMQYSTKNSAGVTTHSGITNPFGEFMYESGDTVTFAIGTLNFPTVMATGILTPLTLSGGGTDITTNQQATNIARLLQSLDANGNPNDGIAIPAGAAAVATAVNFNVNAATFETNAAVLNLVANSGSITTALVTAAAAQTHVAATMNHRVVGAWRGANGAGSNGAFAYLILFSDNTFAYGENDLTVQEPLLENGLEVGTYSYNSITGKITLNLTYDDNTSSNISGSGIGKIGTPSIVEVALSNGDKTLKLKNGALELSRIVFGASSLSGVWRRSSAVAGEFSILMLTDDGVIMYAENDLSVNEPALENGLEVGTYGYSSTTRNITVNLTFDDNTSSAGNSGLAKIGMPAVASVVLSNGNNTLTINGEMMFARDL